MTMQGWVATAALITAYDTWVLIRNRSPFDAELERRRHESMSACWRRWVGQPVPRVGCAVVWTGLTVHLFVQKGKAMPR